MIKKIIQFDDKITELHTVMSVTKVNEAGIVLINVLDFIQGEDMSENREAFFKRFERSHTSEIIFPYDKVDEFENLSEKEIMNDAYNYLVNGDTPYKDAEDYYLSDEERGIEKEVKNG